MKRNIYLETKPLDEALSVFLAAFDFDSMGAGEEEIRTADAAGRITSRPAFAKISSPNYNAAAMDGIALSARDTEGATETSPKRLLIDRDFVFINTGNPLPPGRDAVIMIEDVNEIDELSIEIIRAAVPYQHVRAMGEDAVATELILPASHAIRPYDIGGLLGTGNTMVWVKKRPRFLLIPTGDELVPDTETSLPEGKVFESNSAVIAAMIIEDGGSAVRHPITRDDEGKIKKVLSQNIDGFDAVIVLAGSSAGSRDFSRSIIEELGEVFVHGIAIMPGKPTILGRVGKKPVIGLPGYPVSAVIAYGVIVRPLIARFLGLSLRADETAEVAVLRDIPKPTGTDLFLRVRIADLSGRLVAAPLPRGAGNITTMIRADGIVRIDSLSEGLKAHDTARAHLIRRREDILGTIMAVGSHDICLDLLAGRLRAAHPRYRLASVNVGSLGGIMAIRNGECHLAGSHLLDPETGIYNIPAIQRYLAGVPVSVVTLAFREQGLIVGTGNPKGISRIADLFKDGVTFVNRQRGSGTRILFDYLLKQQELDPRGIHGYGREEFTHLMVAAAVKSGRADAGLGIKAAANALGLGFVPVERERYDLIVQLKYRDDEKVAALIQIVRDTMFHREIVSLGGYDTAETGKESIIEA
jgi:putative molybdopterin biosynthesis protein